MAPTDAVEPLAESPERPIIDLRATLGRGDGFAAMLERAGVAAAEAAQVAAMIGGVVPLADIRAGHDDGHDARPPAEPDGGAAARQARLPRPLRPARRARPGRRRARPSARSRSRSTTRRCASRAWSAPASTARPAPPACRRARSRPISARSTPSCNVPAGINSERPLRHHHRASPRRHRRDRDGRIALCRPQPRERPRACS